MAGAQDTVTLVLDRRTAENHYYALALALGGAGAFGDLGKKGKGKGKGRGKGRYPDKPAPKGRRR